MPNRFLKESICTSDTIDQLTEAEENLFYRLIVNCDDFGRMDARPAIVRARCYPLRLATVSDDDIAARLNRLAEVGLIHLYEADGRLYLQMVTWAKHQQVRAKKSKYPDPPAPDNVCNQLQANDNTCPRIRIRIRNTNSDPDTDSKTRPTAAADRDLDVDPEAGECCRLFEGEFGRPLSPLEAEQILDLHKTFGLDLVREALSRAVAQGKRSIRYVQRILDRWREANLRSLTEVLDYEAKVEQARATKATGGNGQGGRDSPEDAARVVELEKRKRAEKIRAGVAYIRVKLGTNPDRKAAEEIARGYGDVAGEIIAQLYGGEPP